MKTLARHVVTPALVAITCTAVTGLVLRQVGALGIPATPTMYYRGTLDAPAGSHTVRVTLFDAMTAGAMRCQSDTVTVPAGPLEVPLPDACTTAVHDGANLFAELTVDGTPIATRSRLGAVPYAVEADRAVRATAAEPMSALAMQIAALQSQNATLMTQLATLQAQVTATDRDCPNGYTRDSSDTTITATMRLCVRTVFGQRDEVVRVGSGASAFWVDRHEATVYNAAGARFGEGGADYASADGGLAPNGRWFSATVATPRLQAVSRPGMTPSRFVTWFQANEVCRAAGKRLLTREEWFAAIQGTDDPTAGNDGSANARCNTQSGGPRVTGRGATGCVSAWGAQDMIGNLWEWTGEWYAGAGGLTSTPTTSARTVAGLGINDPISITNGAWGADYGSDTTWNVNSTVSNTADDQIGIPSAAVRGGSSNDGTRGGTFALSLHSGPSSWSSSLGFRCVVPG